MIDRIDEHPTPTTQKYFEKRGGKDRRKVHTMIDANRDRRKGNRRKTQSKKYFLESGLERRGWKERRKYWYMTR